MNSTRLRPAGDPARVRLLVVERNEMFLRALLRLIDTEPALALVGAAMSPEEAVLCVESLDPDLVLLAWSWPWLPAEETCRRIRCSPAPPRIVAMLDDEAASYRDSAAAAGADAAVGKAGLGEALMPLLRRLFPERFPEC